MSNSRRDKQFQNFANALYMECSNITQEGMLNDRIDTDQRVIRHIARRAYDLVGHTVNHVSEWNAAERETELMTAEEIVHGYIPDMTELPKEQEPMDMIEENAEKMLRSYDPNRPIKLTFTDGNKRYEGIAFYKGNVEEQEPLSEEVKQAAMQMAKALDPPRDYDNFGRITTFSEGPEPPKEQE